MRQLSPRFPHAPLLEKFGSPPHHPRLPPPPLPADRGGTPAPRYLRRGAARGDITCGGAAPPSRDERAQAAAEGRGGGGRGGKEPERRGGGWRSASRPGKEYFTPLPSKAGPPLYPLAKGTTLSTL